MRRWRLAQGAKSGFTVLVLRAAEFARAIARAGAAGFNAGSESIFQGWVR